jgi:hypothetical protein
MLQAQNPQFRPQESYNPHFQQQQGSSNPQFGQQQQPYGQPQPSYQSPIPNGASNHWANEYDTERRSKAPLFIVLFVVAGAIGAGLLLGTDIFTGGSGGGGGSPDESPDLGGGGGAGPTTGAIPGAGVTLDEFTFKSAVAGDVVTMEVSVAKSVGWLAIGFDGGHGAVDSVHCSFGGPTTATVLDTFATAGSKTAHSLDVSPSNVNLASAEQGDTLTRCTFTRPLSTGDNADATPDKVLTAGGTLNVALAYGNGAITAGQPGGALSYSIHTAKTAGAVTLPLASAGGGGGGGGGGSSTEPPTSPTIENPLITLRYLQEPPPAIAAAVKASFARAAGFWNTVIANDLAVTTPQALIVNQCGDVQFQLPNTLNGLQIGLAIVPIDGPGKILGSAGPCAIDEKANLARSRGGFMRFDSADVEGLLADGQFDDVARHEMGHVLGIGTLWGTNQLVQVGAAPGLDHRYTGANGNLGYRQITNTNTGQAPVENQGGDGTALGHFREATFDNELMTGFLNAGVVNPLSIMSVQALKDLGYTVDASKAEAYVLPAAGAARGVQVNMGGDILDVGIDYEKVRQGMQKRRLLRGEE